MQPRLASARSKGNCSLFNHLFAASQRRTQGRQTLMQHHCQTLFYPNIIFEISLNSFLKSIKLKSNPARKYKANIKRERKNLRHVRAMATVWSVWRPWSSTPEEPHSASLSGAAATLLWFWFLIISTKKRTLALSNIPASDYQHLSYFASTHPPLYLLHQILDKKWENNTFWIVGGHWRFWSLAPWVVYSTVRWQNKNRLSKTPKCEVWELWKANERTRY